MDASCNLKTVERCSMCNKKLKLLMFSCKCNKKFCLNHQLPELHNCIFDYKNIGKDDIKKNNPIITPDKIKTF